MQKCACGRTARFRLVTERLDGVLEIRVPTSTFVCDTCHYAIMSGDQQRTMRKAIKQGLLKGM